ncbi:TraR/DksA C4-type zinc finger protein [Streptomyces sp. NPDC012935]|uniref:TraR/DksA C4-type zinc finger protein n=1 Tax=Streptomyces sp. NPDC012935 TaxID=3364857 RepID=UPI00367FAE7A
MICRSCRGQRFEQALKEIDAVFARLQQGTYGICQGCGRSIPVERLEILPYARCTIAVGVLQVLRPRTVLALDSVMAIALGTGADPFRPPLVIDVGFHLTEVALLADGEIMTARREAMGTRALEDSSRADLVTAITALVTTMMRDDPLPQFVDALDRGPLLAGGGALRPELVSQLSAQQHAPVQPATQPHTAADALRSAQHHPSLGPPLHPTP